jgi:hypothetical protein
MNPRFRMGFLVLAASLSACDPGAESSTPGYRPIQPAQTPAAPPVNRRHVSLDEPSASSADTFEDVLSLFQANREELSSAVEPGFALLPEEEFLLFATVFAYLAAPYGNSVASDLPTLLTEPALDCDNYAALVARLFDAYRAVEQSPSDRVRLRLVGWHGGVVGNHAQLFAYRADDGFEMFLDPTVGIVAFTAYNDVASGKPLEADRIYDFSTRFELAQFRKTVVDALLLGRFRPLDLFYYFEKTERFYQPPAGVETWPTPGAVRFRSELEQSGMEPRAPFAFPAPAH